MVLSKMFISVCVFERILLAHTFIQFHQIATTSFRYKAGQTFKLKSIYNSRAQQDYMEVQQIDNVDSSRNSRKIILSPDLVNSIDIIPLLRAVSKYCGTKRGRDSILSLFASNDDRGKTSSPGSKSDRIRYLYKPMSTASRSESEETLAKGNSELTIIKVAESSVEAQKEYDLVREALTLLLNSKRYNPNSPVEQTFIDLEQETQEQSKQEPQSSDANAYSDAVPPIYSAFTSPFQYNNLDSDDDEWLEPALRGTLSKLELVDILYAEQTVKQILSLQQWSQQSPVQYLAPGIVEIVVLELGNAASSTVKALKKSFDIISNSIEIVRGGRSILDPTGSRSHSLRLSSAKFPALDILRQRELDLISEIESVVKRNYNGKHVVFQDDKSCMSVTVPVKIASSVGIIRGYSENGKFCEVEPFDTVDLSNKLTQVRQEISYLEQDIKYHLVSTLTGAALCIRKGQDLIARIDTLLARASFGYKFNAIFPEVRDEGCVKVMNFIHPVLALSALEKTGSFAQQVIPIDLDISDDVGKQALIISGANGGGKSCALKSFGLTAIMSRLAIPIPVAADSGVGEAIDTRIDFFDDVFLDIGDSQSVMTGYSTSMAKLNSYSHILERITCDQVHQLAGREMGEYFIVDEIESCY